MSIHSSDCILMEVYKGNGEIRVVNPLRPPLFGGGSGRQELQLSSHRHASQAPLFILLRPPSSKASES